MDRTPFAFASLLALVLTVAAHPGAAAAAGAVSLDVPAVVTAGQSVELRWSALPADVEELEIVLSLDGGLTYPVRVSPELEAREGGYRWRVPDLPASRARLMLRMGGEEGERAGARSREFRIVHAEGVPRPELGFHEGEFWTGLDPLEGPARAGLAQDGPRFEDLPDGVPCTPPAPVLRAAPPESVRAPAMRAAAAVAPQGRSAGFAPREVPLRL
jgi:hypothetical protein